jgi:hypothetical protein
MALSNYHLGSDFKLLVSSDDLARNINAVFGEAYIENSNNRPNYLFIEAPEGYDGPFGRGRCHFVQSVNATFPFRNDDHALSFVASPTFSPQRFVGWLNRQYSQLSTA